MEAAGRRLGTILFFKDSQLSATYPWTYNLSWLSKSHLRWVFGTGLVWTWWLLLWSWSWLTQASQKEEYMEGGCPYLPPKAVVVVLRIHLSSMLRTHSQFESWGPYSMCSINLGWLLARQLSSLLYYLSYPSYLIIHNYSLVLDDKPLV